MLRQGLSSITQHITPDPVRDRWPTYVLKTTLISVVAALMLSQVASVVWLELLGWPPGAVPLAGHRTVWMWLSVVVWGPIAESVFLYFACAFARINIPDRPITASVIIGVVAGFLHGLVTPLWFFGPAISFGIWSFAWFRWRTAHPPRGVLILLMPHMLQNLLAMVLTAA